MTELGTITLYIILGMIICWFLMNNGNYGYGYGMRRCGAHPFECMHGAPDGGRPMTGLTAKINDPDTIDDVEQVEDGMEGATGGPNKYDNISTTSYEDFIRAQEISPDVVRAHKEYITETPHMSTVSGKDTVRTDPNNIVPWKGLPRYSRYDINQEGARNVSTELNSQFPVISKQPFRL